MIIVSCWGGKVPLLPSPWSYFRWSHFEPNDLLDCEHMILAFAKQLGPETAWNDFPSGKLFFVTKINFPSNIVHCL